MTRLSDVYTDSSDLPAFLTSADKARFARDSVPFYIEDIRSVEGGKYGSQWYLDILTDDATTEYTLTLPMEPRRDKMMRALLDNLRQTNECIGPVKLVGKPNNFGTLYYSIEDATDD